MNIEDVLKATRAVLGEDADLSYITEEELLRSSKVTDVIEAKVASQIYDGNSYVKFPNGQSQWYEACDTKKKYTASIPTSATRKVNCANGLIHYTITT